MNISMTIDIVLSLFCLFSAIAIIVSRNPVISAFSLLMTFLGMAGIFFKINASFIAVIQIIVYAGAISILFIFVLMLINLSEYRGPTAKRNLGPLFGIIF